MDNQPDPIREMEIHTSKHLSYAEGWLGLGNIREAEQDLNRIDGSCSTSPDVLRVRFDMYWGARKWDEAFTVGLLLSAAPKPVWQDAYKLARVGCKIGNRRQAYDALKCAVRLAGKEEIRVLCLEDKDLEPLWKDIGEIP
jgi:hypothetical protein